MERGIQMKSFFSRHLAKIIMITSLATMLGVMIFSASGDSPIRDEEPHIAAGYSYLTKGDYRLNPEHPPLIKDLAAFPLLFLNLNFPDKLWSEGLNNQWEIGHKFLFNYGNNPDVMLFWSRLPIMLLSVLLGYLVFRWARELYGNKAASLAVVLYAFDANIIAHSRYVTTDLGVAFAFFLHLYVLWKFINTPNWKTLFYSGLTFGVVLVTKFSAALLVPIYGLVFLYLVFKNQKVKSKVVIFSKMASDAIFSRFLGYFAGFGAVAVIGVALMYFFYLPHTLNMNESQQKALISENMYTGTEPIKKVAEISTPFAQYLLGFTMVSAHVSSGHASYLLGKAADGFRMYYPVAFGVKTPLPEIILILTTFVLLIYRKFKSINWFNEFYLLVPVAVFCGMAVLGSLNLGIRYLLPIFPFLFVFVSKTVNLVDFKELSSHIKSKKFFTLSVVSCQLLAVLVLWHIIGSLKTYPHYLSYFNEAIGGPSNGLKYIADSNLDWGQDLKRLKTYVDENNIQNIKIDYFGSGDVEYYFGDKGEVWTSQQGEPTGWFAISASIYAQGTSVWVDHDVNERKRNQIVDPIYYETLKDRKPEAIIGNSILVYNIK